jgi:hypothetical protein
VDAWGNVYITDLENHRIQKFAPGVPGWRQQHVNGFGYRWNGYVGALSPFGEHLYAGTVNWDTGGHLWRKGPDKAWEAISTDGFGYADNVSIEDLVEFDGQLYASTRNATEAGGSNGGQVWRSATGDLGDWHMVASGGFTSTDNLDVWLLSVFESKLYAATWNPSTGAELWRSSSGDTVSWAPVMTGGFGEGADQSFLSSLTEFNGHLYAGTDNTNTGTQVWRSSTGDSGSWNRVNDDGFGDEFNWSVTLEPFAGYLYAGTYNYAESDNPGAELWRCQTCDGSDWQQVPISKGFGDTENRAIRSLTVLHDELFAVTYNATAGMGVWRTADGTDWRQVGPDGLGDSNNISSYWDNSVAVYRDTLYIGTENWANGGEVWMMLRQVYLPLILRNP